MRPDFSKIESLIEIARSENRYFLFEHEIYDVLRAAGVGEPPQTVFIRKTDEASQKLSAIPGNQVVLKIVHPQIAHKSDVGGVRMASRENAESAIKQILESTPKYFSEYLRSRGEFASPDIGSQTLGVIAMPFIESVPGLGHELMLGARFNREFGPVVTVGLGGLDAEYVANQFKRGRSTLNFSPSLNTAEFSTEVSKIAPFQILTGKVRGHQSLIEEQDLLSLITAFKELVAHYSPLNSTAPIWLTELEINPVLFSRGKAVPVDGIFRFKPADEHTELKPLEKIHNLLRPQSVCIIGVSEKGVNVGRVILRNLLASSFKREELAIVKAGIETIDDVRCYPDVSSLPKRFDLTVLSIAAKDVPATLEQLISKEKSESIILITGGMGEKKGSEGIETEIRKLLDKSRNARWRGPIMVGGNSLGIVSTPGHYDTLFVPDSKLPKNPDVPIGKNVAIISQSGAFMITRMSRLWGFKPRYAISTGNQVDLGLADFLGHLGSESENEVIGCYSEGFRSLEGIRFIEVASKLAAEGKDIIVYKAGRSPEGRTAASGHTAAIAGDWEVAESLLRQAGCLVTESFDEFSNLLMLASLLRGRPIAGGKIAAISNAGCEAVGIADNLHVGQYRLSLAEFTQATKEKIIAIQKACRVDTLQDIRNPMDLTPMADDTIHAEVLRVFCEDKGVDLVIHGCVPLSPTMKTLPSDGLDNPKGFLNQIASVFHQVKKPIVLVIDCGELYDPLVNAFLMKGIPVFRSADQAVQALGRWVAHRFERKKR